jgi:hypothetical protein
MLRLVLVNQAAVLQIPQAGTTMGLLHKCITTIATVISIPRIQDLGETMTYFFSLQLSFYFSNRGNCYFFGGGPSNSRMWQTINLTSTISPLLIDNNTVWFNLSAWIGGFENQDDNARVTLTFTNQANVIVGSTTTIGPILAADRGNVTSLLFRQANGLIPISARSFTVSVLMTFVIGGNTDADIDNIAVVLYK